MSTNNNQQMMSTYRCVACNLFFSTFEEQRQHYFSTHQNQPQRALGGNAMNPNQFPKPFANNFSPNASFIKSVNGAGFQQRRPRNVNKVVKPKMDPMKCDLCDVECTGQANYELHIQGKKHIKMLNKSLSGDSLTITVNNQKASDQTDSSKSKPGSVTKPELYCETCDVNCSAIDQMKMHLSGTKHSKKMKLLKYEELKAKKDPSIYCDICDQYMQEDVMEKHRESGKHKRKNTGKIDNSPRKKARMQALSVSTTIEHCGFCELDFANQQEAVFHYQSPRHIVNLHNRSKNFELWCDTCQTSFHSDEVLQKHLNGFKHYARMNRGNKNPEGDLGSKLINQRMKLQALKAKKKAELSDNCDTSTEKNEAMSQ